jgi:phosphoenolpyruvate carboxylase
MLGFSDGTKDGGYLMANWSIYQAKISLTEISRKYGIKAIFFDGRDLQLVVVEKHINFMLL